MSLKLPTNLATPAAYETFRDDALADVARLNRRAARLGYAAPKPGLVQRLADGMAAEQVEDGEDEDRLIRLGERGDVAGEEL